MSARTQNQPHQLRFWLVLGVLLTGLVLLAARALYLQVVHTDFLQSQGAQRHSRVVKDNSHRGMILDRHGSPLAISTPVDSVWAHPATLETERKRWPVLAAALAMTTREFAQLLDRHEGREFMYLKRHVTPDVAERVAALGIDGVALLREYRRYYPLGAVAGHVIGFTNIDDQGQEGIEFAHDAWLRAEPGRKRVIKDLHGTTVEMTESLVLAQPGKDLVLSLDRRIQYLAYRELKHAVEQHQARAGSAVVLDARNGEVLALVNEPDFNPNNRANLKSQVFRNRAVTDLFEPGSTIKPFTVALALESGRFQPSTVIDTAPGSFLVGSKAVRDVHNYGVLTVAGVIEKSSNVGAAKIALALNKQSMWSLLRDLGFGSATGARLPGEAAGLLNPPSRWVPVDQVSIAYGYGLSITPLQLARAYSVFANHGALAPLTLLKRDTAFEAVRVLRPETTRAVGAMLELAVGQKGTGSKAQVPDYRVAGKTGTVRKLINGSYAEDRYVAWFVGHAPVSDPRLVMVVAIDEPRGGRYYGGEVAAPVFGRVMTDALRLLDVAPDAPRVMPAPVVTAHFASAGG
ncbi:MAG: penicillin-binding protein 2 [Pseudomonadota bacterium]|nr:MAG: penicillin-binding protein 2 [Pseudomonadota bacterium]